MDDSVLGERVCAYVVPQTEDLPTLEEVVSFLRSKKIAPYKLPERLEVVRSLPMVSDTKIDKQRLKAGLTPSKGS